MWSLMGSRSQLNHPTLLAPADILQPATIAGPEAHFPTLRAWWLPTPWNMKLNAQWHTAAATTAAATAAANDVIGQLDVATHAVLVVATMAATVCGEAKALSSGANIALLPRK